MIFLCLYVSLLILIGKSNCRKISVKLLQDQLRVTKESHALDVREIHDEIGSLKVKLAEISYIVNGSDVSNANSVGVGQSFINSQFQKTLQRCETDLQASEKYIVNVAEVLKNGFKSFKAWNTVHINEMTAKVLYLAESVDKNRQEYKSKLDTFREDLSQNNNNILEVKESFDLLGESLHHQTSQALKQVENMCMAEIKTHIATTGTKLDELEKQVDKILKRLPAYSVMKEEWMIVFRAQAGNGDRVYDAWVSGQGVRTTFPTDKEKFSSGTAHYRNPVIDSWNNIGVQFVRVALHERDGREVAFILFDGVRTDKMNWFDQRRILDSSWNQLSYHSPLNHASISGESSLNRRFFINIRYEGCHNDHGFLLVSDPGSMPCNYEQVPEKPQLLYSKFPGGTRWSSMCFGIADSMVITVKTN